MHQERERPVHNSDLHGIVAIGAANLCHSIKKNAIRQLSNFGLTHGVCGADQGTAGLSVVCRLEGVSPSSPPADLEDPEAGRSLHAASNAQRTLGLSGDLALEPKSHF